MKKPCTVVWLLLVVAMLPIVAFCAVTKESKRKFVPIQDTAKAGTGKIKFFG